MIDVITENNSKLSITYKVHKVFARLRRNDLSNLIENCQSCQYVLIIQHRYVFRIVIFSLNMSIELSVTIIIEFFNSV